MNNIEQEKEQGKMKAAFRAADYNGAGIVTVGFGKGKVMLDMAMELVKAERVTSILYLCNSTNLRDIGFLAEILKWQPELKYTIDRQCYQTAYKWKDRHYDLVLGDECDYAISPQYVKVFLYNSFRFKILVSGTLDKFKEKTLMKIVPVVYRLHTEDAEAKGIINRSTYWVYNYKMTEEEAKEYNRLTAKIAMSMISGQQKQATFWIRKRKHFLNSLESSYLHCRKIMQSICNRDPNNRVVIFCELQEQASRVCKWSYHGGNESENNLERFQTGEINAIAVVEKITRGTNLKKANVAIFEGLSGSSTKFEQRNGRMKRLKISENATIVFMIPWHYKLEEGTGNRLWKPTVVDDWINKAVANFKNIEFKTFKL